MQPLHPFVGHEHTHLLGADVGGQRVEFAKPETRAHDAAVGRVVDVVREESREGRITGFCGGSEVFVFAGMKGASGDYLAN